MIAASLAARKSRSEHYNAQRIGFFCPDLDQSEMPTLEDLSERVERLLLRHQELKQTQALLEQQVVALIDERDVLRMRLNAARDRIDVLLGRNVPVGIVATIQSFEPAQPEQASEAAVPS